MTDVFIGTLNDNIQLEFHVWEPESLEKAFKVKLKAKLWEQGCLPLTTIDMEVLLLLASHHLQG